MNQGRLEQYDTPAAILARPASDLVIDLLGPDRGLKRLSVTAIEPATLEKPPMIHLDDSLSAARGLFATGAERVLVMDSNERLYGELDRDAANGDGRVRDRVRPVDARINADRTLYDAFSQMLIHRASWVAVLNGDRLVGVLTPASFLSAIRNVPAEVEGAGANAR
jgi:osmoprotectant transport system ATP-binding protein